MADMADFAHLLRARREAAGLSQRGLAQQSGINPAIINRIESGDRGASGPEQVLASAGFWPRACLRLGPGDPSLLTVARVLTSERLDEAARARFRRIVDELAAQWLAPPASPAGHA